MSSDPRVKCVVITRIADNTTLATYSTDKKLESNYKNESKTVLDKLQDVRLKAGERQKIRTTNGAWFSTCDLKDIFYLVLADSSYPEKHAYNLANEVTEELSTMNNYFSSTPVNVQKHTQHYIPNLLKKYNDLQNLDELAKTQSKVNQIKSVMSDTIHRALENRETFEELDKKADDMSMLAKDFHTGSSESSKKDEKS